MIEWIAQSARHIPSVIALIIKIIVGLAIVIAPMALGAYLIETGWFIIGHLTISIGAIWFLAAGAGLADIQEP